MSTLRRLTPVAWLIGVAVLAVSLIGAAGGLDAQDDAVIEPGTSQSPRTEETFGVVCFGTTDVEGGLLELRPPTFPQPSRVVEIHEGLKEGRHVEKGQWLVRFDDTAQRTTLLKAEQAIEEARGKLDQVKEEAEVARKKHTHLWRIQESVITAKGHELAAAKARFDLLKEIEAKGKERGVRLTNDQEIEEAQEKVHAFEESVEVERRRLDQIKDMEPDFSSGIRQAEAAIRRYEAEKELAQYALDLTKLEAPTSGVVLQSNVRLGTQFGPQTQSPAVILKPDNSELIVRAEVDQEFAHRLRQGQPVELFPAKGATARWTGVVTHIDEAYLPARSAGKMPNPFQSDEALPLGFTVSLKRTGDGPPKIGQRLRVNVAVP